MIDVMKCFVSRKKIAKNTAILDCKHVNGKFLETYPDFDERSRDYLYYDLAYLTKITFLFFSNAFGLQTA